MNTVINTAEMSYREMVSMARDAGMQDAHKSSKQALIEFLTGLEVAPGEESDEVTDLVQVEEQAEELPKRKREKKEVDPRILEMATGEFTRREIAKACGCSYSDVYFALKAAGLGAKPAKKVKDLADAAE